jgi:hypothetical protein
MAEANSEPNKLSHHTSLISPAPTTGKTSLDFHLQHLENFILIWLDANINIRNNDYNSSIADLQKLVHVILPFTDPDPCIDFISNIKNEKIFLIVSGSLGQNIIPLLHDLYQIDSIYIYCDNKSKHEKWAHKEKKIKGVYTKIPPIYDALRRDIRQCEDDLISFSILSSTYHKSLKLNPSDQLFIYIQSLKEILTQMEYQPNTKIDLVNFSDFIYQNNHYQLNIINEFQNDYQQSSSIWWYTRECFLSSMLNKAFRIRNIDILIKMGFFIRDLHQEITRLYSKLNKSNHLIVYRGHGILEKDFRRILENQNGFLSFNNFLITTTDKTSSLIYARCARDNHELIGVLFQMEIDRTKSVFTPLDKINYYSESEGEILFTTHTIFRIHTIDELEDGLWQIQLRLSMNEDQQLKHVKELIEKEIQGRNGSEQLDALMIKIQRLSESEPQAMELEMGEKDRTGMSSQLT